VTLTLDTELLRQLRDLVGPRSLSATVNSALSAHVARLRHLAAVDAWLTELEEERGPLPEEALEWAATTVDRWDAGRSKGTAAERRVS